jgi:hypothetical protein
VKVIGSRRAALRAVVQNEVVRPKLCGQHEHRLDIALYLLLDMPVVNYREVTVEDGKRIAEDYQAVAVSDALLFQRKILRAQKATSLADRRLVHGCGSAADSFGVVLYYNLGFPDPHALCLYLRKRVVAFAKQGPRLSLLLDQSVNTRGEARSALRFKIAMQLFFADYSLVPIHL